MKRLAIFASGTGTNAEAILEYLKKDPVVSVSLILTNNPEAKVIQVAEKYNVPILKVNKESFYDESMLKTLENNCIDLIILAGFLWLVPDFIIDKYPGRIINIHPALLPKYGGKGMYGMLVHEAVSHSGDTQTGITIHFVNKEYDKGQIIAQFKLKIEPHEKPESIAAKVLKLEHLHFPRIVREEASGL
jgi:phosphoribosylglycinamide formyltransferase 1